MQNISRICECCHKNYKVESTDETTICPQCNHRWEVESRWEASERAWREQENEMLQARGIIIEDGEDESDFCDWLCESAVIRYMTADTMSVDTAALHFLTMLSET